MWKWIFYFFRIRSEGDEPRRGHLSPSGRRWASTDWLTVSTSSMRASSTPATPCYHSHFLFSKFFFLKVFCDFFLINAKSSYYHSKHVGLCEWWQAQVWSIEIISKWLRFIKLKEKKRKEWNGMEDCFPTECSIGYCFAVDAGNCSRSSAAIFLFIFTTTATATAVEIPGVTYEFPHYHFPSFSSLQWEKKNNVFFFSFFLVFFLCLSFRVTLMLSGWDMGIT